jgi:hypothetical protein
MSLLEWIISNSLVLRMGRTAFSTLEYRQVDGQKSVILITLFVFFGQIGTIQSQHLARYFGAK